MVLDCLRSIAPQRAGFDVLHIVVVDNDSGDGSYEMISDAVSREDWEAWVSVVASGRNGGFAYGNNVGIRLALEASQRPDFVMLLNPDTIVPAGALQKLLHFMQSNQLVGIAGSLLENGEGGPECAAHNAPSPVGELVSAANLGMLSRLLHRYVVTPPIRDESHECEWVSGASFMVRREVFEKIGLMDEEFFLYFEEVDFCTRARRDGWHVWFVRESCIVHLEGAATGIRHMARRRPRYWYDSRRRYFIKHFGISGLIFADMLWAAGRLSLAIRSLFGLGKGGRVDGPKWFAFDLLWGDMRFLLGGGGSGTRQS